MKDEVIHEACNMLTVILGSVEQLRRQQLSERGMMQLGRTEEAAWRLSRLLSRPCDDPDGAAS